MYKTISSILFPIVTVALIGTLGWGLQTNHDKNAVLIRAENQYQRSFHELSYHMDHLHRELGNALAVNSTSQGFHRRCLINAWRLTNEAQANVNQLPLYGESFEKTEQLLSKIAKFSYQTAVRDLAKEPLSEQEMATLKSLVDQSRVISDELNNMQAVAISQNLSWLDVEAASASSDGQSSHSLIDGFNKVNETVSEYTEAGWGPAIMNMFEDMNFSKIEGRPYTEQEIKQKAVEFLQLPASTPVEVTLNNHNPKYESYGVTVQADGHAIRMDYSKQGGQLMWFMDDRHVAESTMSLEQASEKAKQYLKTHGYDEMHPVNFNEHDNVAYMTMVRVSDDIIIYPEKISISVALDDGEIIGLQASELSMEQEDIAISPAGLTLEEAKNRLNPNFKIKDHTLAVIENELNKNVLCYQFIGNINDTNYRIFINADSGLEEKLEQLK